MRTVLILAVLCGMARAEQAVEKPPAPPDSKNVVEEKTKATPAEDAERIAPRKHSVSSRAQNNAHTDMLLQRLYDQMDVLSELLDNLQIAYDSNDDPVTVIFPNGNWQTRSRASLLPYISLIKGRIDKLQKKIDLFPRQF